MPTERYIVEILVMRVTDGSMTVEQARALAHDWTRTLVQIRQLQEAS